MEYKNMNNEQMADLLETVEIGCISARLLVAAAARIREQEVMYLTYSYTCKDGHEETETLTIDEAIEAICEYRFRLEKAESELSNLCTRKRVMICDGWRDAGKIGTTLGPPVFAEQNWTPVLWDDEEDPDFHKTAGLISIDEREQQ